MHVGFVQVTEKLCCMYVHACVRNEDVFLCLCVCMFLCLYVCVCVHADVKSAFAPMREWNPKGPLVTYF